MAGKEHKPRLATRRDFETLALWTEISEGIRATTRSIDLAVSRDFALDSGEADVLLLLGRSPGKRLTMTELAKAIGFTSGGVTKVAGRLLARDLVQRQGDSGDRRIVRLMLTPEGERVANEVCCVISDVVRSQWSDVLGEDRARQLAASIAEVRSAPRPTSAD
ncbi:MarR family winged helix-turn-helix transcriptional regulator [Subtercola boreus]|nr:MarR family winged helix-turn-helix transcriptional regulator [Subtercola boreus]